MMKSQYNNLIIIGNIGVGKSTLTTNLYNYLCNNHAKVNPQLLPEQFLGNIYLEPMYKMTQQYEQEKQEKEQEKQEKQQEKQQEKYSKTLDFLKTYSLLVQAEFIRQKDEFLDNHMRKYDKLYIHDRHMEETLIFSKTFIDKGFLSDMNYCIIQDLINKNKPKYYSEKDVLIYLRSDDISLILSRIQKRGREMEKGIKYDYIEGLNRHYEEVYREREDIHKIDIKNKDEKQILHEVLQIMQMRGQI